MDQKKAFTQEKSSAPPKLLWNTNMAAVSLFWKTNMAAVTSCKNTLYLIAETLAEKKEKTPSMDKLV